MSLAGTSLMQAPLRAGDVVGHYRLLEPLGQGGVALVYKARDERTGAVVAVKSVRLPREGLLASIRREIRALECLMHPGIIRIYESGVAEGVPWFAMDLLEGQTLRRRLGVTPISAIRSTLLPLDMTPRSTAVTLPNLDNQWLAATLSKRSASDVFAPIATPDLPWFLTVICRLCEPLAYMHGQGVVHRDLSPGNVFVRLDGTPVVMDFGLVWRLETTEGRGVLSIDAARAGTIAYMAPEQARGEAVDARSDLFSLGCMIYEGLTGRVPFPAHNLDELRVLHEQGPPVLPVHGTGEALPRVLAETVMSLLQIDPRDRMGHASNVAAVLQDLGAEGWPPASGVRAEPRAYLYRSRLVGRYDALDRIVAEVARLSQRRGGCLFVGGEPGIGKTSLAFEVSRAASLAGVRVITCECVAVGLIHGRGIRRSGPLYPFAPLLQAMADRCLAGGLAETARLLGERAKVLAVTEPSLATLPGVGSYPDPPEVPSDAARRRLIEALADTLARFTADRATLLVLEDVQWADDTTLAFLAVLSASYCDAHPLLVVATYRLGAIEPELQRIIDAPHVKHLVLEPLDADSLVAIASEMLAQREVPERLQSFLRQQASGNPFFVSEYLRAVVDARLLYRDPRGRWRDKESGASSTDALDAPRTLDEVISRRLESMPAAAQKIAAAAAVLGRDVAIERLCELSLLTDTVGTTEDFEEGLRVLSVRDVLAPSVNGSMRFAHDRLREVAYQRLASARLVALHGASAHLLERHHRESGTLQRAYSILAHHFERANEDARALWYLDRAGDTSHAMHANQEALSLLTRAEMLDTRLGRPTSTLLRARRWRQIGLNSLALGDLRGAFDALTEATRVAGRPWPTTHVQRARRCLSALGGELARRWLPTMLARPLPVGEERELLLEAARSYERLFVVNYFNADMVGVTVSGLTNMALAERAGGPIGERALGYATFGAMCALSTLDGVAQSYCRRAIAIALESRDELAETWVLMNVGVVHLQAGRWAASERCLERVRAISARIGFSRRWEEATTQFSTACFLAGRFDDAERFNTELLGAVERADPQSRCWAIVRRAELSLVRGDAPAAVRAAREGERWCVGLQAGEWVYTLGALALGLLRSGELAAARDEADRCLDWIERCSAPLFYNVFAHTSLIEVYFRLWLAEDRPRRSPLLDLARRVMRRLGSIARAMAIAAPSLALWRGFEAVYTGQRRSDARRWFEQSAKRAKALDMKYDRALALAALGEHVPTDRRQASRWLDEAIEVFAEIGARHHLRQVRRSRELINR